MAEHRASMVIAAPPAAVFAFLANPMNLPRWQPAIREAFHEGPDRIRAIGGGVATEGHASHPSFTAEPGEGRVAWQAGPCAGEAQVAARPDGARLELVLRLAAPAERPEAVADWTGDPALDVDGALRASLAAVKAAVEDRGESVGLVSGGTQSHPDDDGALRDSRPYGRSATQNPDTT